MEGSSSRSNHLLNAFTSPRPAPKPTPPITYDDDHHSGRSTPQNGNGWKNTSEKRTLEHPKTAITSGRVGYEVVVPVMSSSISTPTPSTSSVGVSGNDNTPPSSTTLTPSSAKRAGTISRKPSENLLSELGLESGMANVIYTIMMDQNQNGNWRQSFHLLWIYQFFYLPLFPSYIFYFMGCDGYRRSMFHRLKLVA